MRARYADVALSSVTGRPLAGVTVDVFNEASTTPIAGPIWSAPTGGATLPNPLTTNSQGELVFYLAAPVRVDLRWGGSVVAEVETVDVLFSDPPVAIDGGGA